VLVSRLNIAFGISDKIMVVFGSALPDAVNQLKYVHFSLIAIFSCYLLFVRQ
jgi:hypothetical protein